MRDIVNHYRTLIAEGLDHVYYHETFEFLGTRIDDAAGRLARKIRPPRPESPAPSLEGWQPMGWTDGDALPSFLQFDESQVTPFNSIAQAYVDDMMSRMSAGPTSSEAIEALFRPKVDQAEKMREAIRPMLEKLGEVEWRAPEIRTANAQESIRQALNIKPFSATAQEVYSPAFSDIQSNINDMVARLARAQDDIMRGAITRTFIMGVDPESEWTKVSRERVEKMATIPVGEDRVADWIVGIPLYVDPDDDTMLRMKTADIYAAPNGPKIIETVFGVSDPDGSVEDNPTT